MDGSALNDMRMVKSTLSLYISFQNVEKQLSHALTVWGPLGFLTKYGVKRSFLILKLANHSKPKHFFGLKNAAFLKKPISNSNIVLDTEL